MRSDRPSQRSQNEKHRAQRAAELLAAEQFTICVVFQALKVAVERTSGGMGTAEQLDVDRIRSTGVRSVLNRDSLLKESACAKMR